MGLEEEGGNKGIDLAGYFAKVKLRELEQKEINDKIEGMGKKISIMGQNLEKVALGLDGREEGTKTIKSFSIQECWNRIRDSEHGWMDMDKIFSGRFAEDSGFRKKALAELSDDKVVEMVKNKELDGILTGVCKDKACRADLTARVREAERGKEKKLL